MQGENWSRFCHVIRSLLVLIKWKVKNYIILYYTIPIVAIFICGWRPQTRKMNYCLYFSETLLEHLQRCMTWTVGNLAFLCLRETLLVEWSIDTSQLFKQMQVTSVFICHLQPSSHYVAYCLSSLVNLLLQLPSPCTTH